MDTLMGFCFFYIGLLHSGPAFAEGGVKSPPSVYILLPKTSPPLIIPEV